MDLGIPIVFFVFAFICWIVALFEERDTNNVSGDEEEKSYNLIILLLGIGTVLFFIAGVCMMNVTETYYSTVTDTLEEINQSSYRPLGYIGIGLGILSILLTSKKVFDYLGSQWEQG
jgi:heme/copper-type cytochrome/quinol oxidase subunit 2